MVTDTIIKKGYKQTELGVIPEGWNIGKLPTVCWFQEGPGLRNWQFTNSGIKVINVTNLENGYLNLERTSRYISIEEFQRMYQHFEVDDKDIIVASSGNSYAKVAVVRNQDLPLVMNTSVIRFKPLKNLDYSFLLTFLKSNYFKDQIDLFITGGAQPNFGPVHLKQINIIIPSNKSEQTAIAVVLSDTDALIEHLEKLIAKKKSIKQGTMQKLLTGKKRLPGFSGEWEVKELRELVDFSNGKAHENFISDNGDYIVVNSKFISTEGRVAKYSNDCFSPVSTDSILMVMSDVPNGKAIAKCFLVDKDDKYTVNQRICALKPKIDSKFLYYKINRNPFYLSFDDGVKQTNLRKDDVLDCKLSIPNDKREQTAIATVLSDMDSEIESLEQKRDKYTMLKQGMMHQLLTGRIRIYANN